jgi:hypothetical protein
MLNPEHRSRPYHDGQKAKWGSERKREASPITDLESPHHQNIWLDDFSLLSVERPRKLRDNASRMLR